MSEAALERFIAAAGLAEDRADVGGPLRGHTKDGPTGQRTPTAQDPLFGLHHLTRVAVVGREAILALADRPIVWTWDSVATAGLTILLAAGPGSGKTTLLAMLVVARANQGQPVSVLGRLVSPAPRGTFLVFVENEHSDESAARILRKACDQLGVSYDALDRIILVARGSVRIGSAVWGDVERLIAVGLVGDVVLDTLARCTPSASSDANDEQEQGAVFERISQAIELAPMPEARPMCWVAAHTRKCDGIPTLNDVGGSTQRAGQPDVVLLMGANRSAQRVRSVTVVFGKVREKDAEDWPAPVEYVVTKAGVELLDAPAGDDRPLEERIVCQLARGPQTKTALATALARSRADLEEPISNLFAAHQIAKTTVKLKGRTWPAFEARNGTGQSPGRVPQADDTGGGRTNQREGLDHAA
jgi:hypothetical protein